MIGPGSDKKSEFEIQPWRTSDIQPVLHKPKTPHNLKKDQKVHIISTTPSHRQYLGEVTSNVLDCSITPFLSLSLTMITHLILSLFAPLLEKCHKPCHWGISDLLSSPQMHWQQLGIVTTAPLFRPNYAIYIFWAPGLSFQATPCHPSITMDDLLHQCRQILRS